MQLVGEPTKQQRQPRHGPGSSEGWQGQMPYRLVADQPLPPTRREETGSYCANKPDWDAFGAMLRLVAALSAATRGTSPATTCMRRRLLGLPGTSIASALHRTQGGVIPLFRRSV